jgi:hypothetical protein
MGYEYSTLTSDSTGLKKRSTRSTAIVRGSVAATFQSRKTAMSRRTKKHRNANINLEKING